MPASRRPGRLSSSCSWPPRVSPWCGCVVSSCLTCSSGCCSSPRGPQDREHVLPLRPLLPGVGAVPAKGPPALLLRLLGPIVVVSTVAVLGTGVALLFVPRGGRHEWLFLHKVSFVVWFGAMAVHVLGHLADTARLAPRDWYVRTRRDVRGAGIRQWAVAASIVTGVLLGILLVGRSGPWL
jgi:hypothetical protein